MKKNINKINQNCHPELVSGSMVGSAWRVGKNLDGLCQRANGFRTKSGMTDQSGRSMVEMLGVLAIIGVLSVGGIAGYTTAMNKHRANEILNAASVRAMMITTQLAQGRKAAELSLAEFGEEKVQGVSFDKEYTDGAETFALTLTWDTANPSVCNQIKNIVGENVTVDTGCATFTYKNEFGVSSQQNSNIPTTQEECKGKYKWCNTGWGEVCTDDASKCCEGVTCTNGECRNGQCSSYLSCTEITDTEDEHYGWFKLSDNTSIDRCPTESDNYGCGDMECAICRKDQKVYCCEAGECICADEDTTGGCNYYPGGEIPYACKPDQATKCIVPTSEKLDFFVCVSSDNKTPYCNFDNEGGYLVDYCDDESMQVARCGGFTTCILKGTPYRCGDDDLITCPKDQVFSDCSNSECIDKNLQLGRDYYCDEGNVVQCQPGETLGYSEIGLSVCCSSSERPVQVQYVDDYLCVGKNSVVFNENGYLVECSSDTTKALCDE